MICYKSLFSIFIPAVFRLIFRRKRDTKKALSRKERSAILTLDCLGDMCPLPAMKLMNALENGKASGEGILLITDHSCVPDSIRRLCKNKGVFCDIDEPVPGVWEIRVTKP